MFNFLKKKAKSAHNGTLPTEEKTVESAVVQEPTMGILESDFAMPIDGKIIPLTEVPDQVFAQGMMGQGFAIAPTGNTVYSPIDGKIVSIFPTKHAIGLVTDTGVEILIHVGVDTVKLKGQGFEQLAEDGQVVKRGDALLKIDLAYIEANAPSSIIPIIFTNLTSEKLSVLKDGDQQHGETGILNIQ
jgi:PTS system N-acetylglucosamine-specific IIC component